MTRRAGDAPVVRVRGVEIFERDIEMRLPFRFGAVTLRQATEAHVRVRVVVDGAESRGVAAETLAPKWFDKSPVLSEAESVEQLRTSLRLAAAAYVETGPSTAFGLHATQYAEQLRQGAALGLPPLAAGLGLALLDKAVVDAVAKARGTGLSRLVREGALGLDARLTPDLDGFDLLAFWESLVPLSTVEARHTVGLLDPLTAEDIGPGARPDDGLPVTLEEIVSVYGHRWFKLKVGGEVETDLRRLVDIALVLDRIEGRYAVSIDGNEQYRSVPDLMGLIEALDAAPGLDRFRAAIAYIEQPIDRDTSRSTDVRAAAARYPMIIDESDGDFDAFPHHAGLGYTGVSSKSCKGLYKALLNRARCAARNAEAGSGAYFMTAEDLTAQAGLSVQQDLALVATLGIGHVERNGHHYGRGMSAAPPFEVAAFLDRHPELYRTVRGVACLDIRDGRLPTAALAAMPGLGGPVEPAVSAMRAVAAYGDTG